MCDHCGYVQRVSDCPATCLEARDILFFRTLSLPRPPFIHQLAVDAYGAQHLTDQSPKIAKLFTLMGLYMVAEQGATGYEVQKAHQGKAMEMDRSNWPNLTIRPRQFTLNVGDMLTASELQSSLHDWVQATWEAYHDLHDSIRAFREAYCP